MPDPLAFVDSPPHPVSWHAEPKSAQVTPLFCGSFCTVAMNCCVVLMGTLGAGGETVTTRTGVVLTVMFASSDLLMSATDVAVSVTAIGDGAEVGAV